jgi:aspartate kinase
MGNAQTWRQVIDIIRSYERPVVVVSATARTTRQLIAAAQHTLTDFPKAKSIADNIRHRHLTLVRNVINNSPNDEPEVEKKCKLWIEEMHQLLLELLTSVAERKKLTAADKDAVASVGEQLSSYLFAQCGTTAGLPTRWIDAADLIRTNSDFGRAEPDTNFIIQKATNLPLLHQEHIIPVIGGYYGQDKKGNTTTLGFEGSDYTASLLGSALSANTIEIWTDVSGIYTCDPRVIEDATPIPELSFREATELAYFGAKVLHPATTKPASEKNIPVLVKNIFAPGEPGTRISHEASKNGRAKALTFKQNCSVITVTSSHTVMGYEFLSGVFETLRNHHLPVDVVTTTEASVSIAVETTGTLDEVKQDLQAYGSVSITHEQGIISLVGCDPEHTKELLNDVLEDLDGTPEMISFRRTKGNLNVVLDTQHVLKATRTIHRRLF